MLIIACQQVGRRLSAQHGCVQPRLDLHGHQFLEQQLAGVGDLDLTDVLGRVTAAAVVLELK